MSFPIFTTQEAFTGYISSCFLTRDLSFLGGKIIQNMLCEQCKESRDEKTVLGED